MSVMLEAWNDLLTAVQFLTRVPVPERAYAPESMRRAVVFYPVVGLALGAAAGGLDVWLIPHMGRWGAGLGALVVLVLLTGCLHEDALADAADGFGGGWNQEGILRILKDSRIGSYGAAALGLSLMARWWMLSTIAVGDVVRYAIAAEVLGRWTALPMGWWLPAAREEAGLGAAVTGRTGGWRVVVGSGMTLGIVGVALGSRAVAPMGFAGLVTVGTGWYYRRKIGGVTGDCFGATVLLAEMAVLGCGVWR